MLTKDADKLLEWKIDNNDYHESQLVEFKVPIIIPYQPSQSDFERCYGEIEIEGKYYTYVKRKIENGYLILKCIANDSKEQIKAAGNDYFQLANGLAHSDSKQHKTNVAKTLMGDYDDRTIDYTFQCPLTILHKDAMNQASCLFQTCLAIPHQPPDADRS